jgi:hypothetical protein
MSPDRRALAQVVASRILVTLGTALLALTCYFAYLHLGDGEVLCSGLAAEAGSEISSIRLTILPPGVQCSVAPQGGLTRVVGVAGTGTVLALVALPLGLIGAGVVVKIVSLAQQEMAWRRPVVAAHPGGYRDRMTTDSTPRPDDTTAAKSPAEIELDDSLRSIREVGESATGRTAEDTSDRDS